MREKSVNSFPDDGPVRVSQDEYAASATTPPSVSALTPKNVTSSASSWIAMFFSMPSALRSKHSASSSALYALWWTSVKSPPGTLASASRPLVTYLVTFLLKPIQIVAPLAAASSFMRPSSSTVGAPGFSRRMCVAPAAMAWRKNLGLSGVRPAMSAILGPSVAPLKRSPESTDAWNATPFAPQSATTFWNSWPGGESLPPPRNHGSTMSESRAPGTLPSRSWRPWYQPMPRPGKPQPTIA
mmetsp:Transcript_10393/g.31961  ORF Transcript_10393/g.31961 Transcript_10393/m.31961 type:complete len:241 (+) Transcript_10393:443-1165(+)